MGLDDGLTTEAMDKNMMLSTWPGLDLPLIEDLPNPFSVEDLIKRDFASVVERLVGEAIRTNNVPDACELVRRLKLVKSVKENGSGLYNFYQGLVILLKFVSLAIHKEKEVKILLSESLLYALRNNIDVGEKLQEYLKIDEGGVGVDKELRRGLIYSLEHNQEKLGGSSLVLNDGNKVSPVVSNWLASYNDQQHLSQARSKFNQINYLNTNADARGLNNFDKTTLKQVLEIYDRLLFPPPGPEIVSDGSSDEQEIVKQLSSISPEKLAQLLGLPGESESSEKLPPVIPAPKNQPVQRPMEEVRKNLNSQYPISNEETTTSPPVPVASMNIGSATGQANISSERRGIDAESLVKPVVKPVSTMEAVKPKLMGDDFVQPGLKMWNSNPPQMGQRIPSSEGVEVILNKNATSPQPSLYPSSIPDESARYGAGKARERTPAVDIDKKLEDLEKRITPVK